MKASWLLVLVGLAAPASADPAAARESLVRCATDAGGETVTLSEQTCPGMAAALAELGLTELLSDEKRDALTASELLDLTELERRYVGVESTRLDTGQVGDILQELAGAPPHERSWWQRFKDWLRQILKPESGELPGWLVRALDKLSAYQDAIAIFAYLAIGLVILIAVGIVIVELRAAGLFKGSERSAKNAAQGQSWLGGESLSLSDVESAPLLERPALLLRLLAQLLVRGGRLRAESNLTHRELVRAAQLTKARDRARFESLAMLAERIRYGRREDDGVDESAASILSDGRDLYAEWRAANAGRQS